MKASLGGGSVTMLAESDGGEFTENGGPREIAVDATSVYWTNDGTVAACGGDGSVMKVPLTGGRLAHHARLRTAHARAHRR